MKSMLIGCFWSPCTQFLRYFFLLKTTGKRSSKQLIWVVQPRWTPKNNRVTRCSNFNWFENVLLQTSFC